MAMLVTGNREFDVRVENLTGGSFVRVDKEKCESVIAAVARFAIANGRTDAGLRTLVLPPLNLREVRRGIELIAGLPFVLIVPNDMNRDPTDNGVFLTRKITVGVNDTRLIALIGGGNLFGVRSRERAEVEVLGISFSAWQAVERHCESLEKNDNTKVAEAERRRIAEVKEAARKKALVQEGSRQRVEVVERLQAIQAAVETDRLRAAKAVAEAEKTQKEAAEETVRARQLQANTEALLVEIRQQRARGRFVCTCTVS